MAIKPNKENKMEYLIIPILIAVVIAICGIMATIPAPHTYSENIKIHEPTLALPHGAIVNLGGDFDPYPPIYDVPTLDQPSNYRVELIKIVRDMISGQFTAQAWCEYEKRERLNGMTPLEEDVWRKKAVDQVINQNQLIFDFSEDLHLQPHDFHNVINITEGEKS
jgi:hypothetical protein